MKKIALLLIAVVLAASIFFGVNAARSSPVDRDDHVVSPSELPANFVLPPRPKELTVMFALTSRYAAYEKGYWAYRSCEGMTKDGCSYFLNNEAERYYASLDQNVGVIVPKFLGNVKELGHGFELWRVNLQVIAGKKTTYRDIYAVVKNVDGEWLLDRVIMDVEANNEEG